MQQHVPEPAAEDCPGHDPEHDEQQVVAAEVSPGVGVGVGVGVSVEVGRGGGIEARLRWSPPGKDRRDDDREQDHPGQGERFES